MHLKMSISWYLITLKVVQVLQEPRRFQTDRIVHKQRNLFLLQSLFTLHQVKKLAVISFYNYDERSKLQVFLTWIFCCFVNICFWWKKLQLLKNLWSAPFWPKWVQLFTSLSSLDSYILWQVKPTILLCLRWNLTTFWG